MLDSKTSGLIKATIPILNERGTEITKHFYKIMFQNNPEVKGMFNQDKQDNGKQPFALASAIIAVAENIDDLPKITPAVKHIAKIHVDVKVLPEHYPIVGGNLIQALKDVLGPDIATDEIIAAWTEVYGVIAEVFIEEERKLYEEAK